MRLRVAAAAAVLAVLPISVEPASAGGIRTKGDDGHFEVAGSVYYAAGGQDSVGRAHPAAFRYKGEDIETICKDNPGCRLGNPDTCPRFNQLPGDDFRLSATYRRQIIPPPPKNKKSDWELVIGTAGCLNWRVLKNKPVITLAMVKDQVQKVLPDAVWRTQPPPGKDALVNFPALVSIQTPQDATYRFTILQQPIVATAHVRVYHWTFGDGSSMDADWPGHAWVDGDHCDRESCPGYLFHVYQQTGPMKIQPTLLWTVHYRVGNAPEQLIPGDMQTNGPEQQLNLVESHAVLVDPDH